VHTHAHTRHSHTPTRAHTPAHTPAHSLPHVRAHASTHTHAQVNLLLNRDTKSYLKKVACTPDIIGPQVGRPHARMHTRTHAHARMHARTHACTIVSLQDFANMGADFRADEKCHLALLAAEASPFPPPARARRCRVPLSHGRTGVHPCPAFALDNLAQASTAACRRMTIGACHSAVVAARACLQARRQAGLLHALKAITDYARSSSKSSV
jgi:hypothetical protein